MRADREAGLSVNRTPRTGDGGADIVVRLSPNSLKGGFVQVKHRSHGKVGFVSEKEVLDVLRARERYPSICDPAFFLVTNGSVDRKTEGVAKGKNVKVIDYSNLGRLTTVVKESLTHVMT